MSENNVLRIYGIEDGDIVKVYIEQPYINLSFYDLNQVDGFKSAKAANDKKKMEEILWTNGLDINKPYTVVKCLHRPMTIKYAYDGLRFEGTERIDKDWIVNGSPSLESYLYTKDYWLRKELNEMNSSLNINYETENYVKNNLEHFISEEKHSE